MVRKVVLNGFGRIGRILYSGADVLYTANKESVLPQVTDICFYNNKLLVEAYRKTRSKYYPEKDILIKGEIKYDT